MTIVKCVWCKAEFERANYLKGFETKNLKRFCCNACAVSYRAKKGSTYNNEYHKEYQKGYYNRSNKVEWYSRSCTNATLIRLNKLLEKKCKECGSKNNIELHHEIYPTKRLEVISAILKRRIYYLCKNCHAKTRKSYRKEKEKDWQDKRLGENQRKFIEEYCSI